jgi:hypothetical protein
MAGGSSRRLPGRDGGCGGGESPAWSVREGGAWGVSRARSYRLHGERAAPVRLRSVNTGRLRASGSLHAGCRDAGTVRSRTRAAITGRGAFCGFRVSSDTGR